MFRCRRCIFAKITCSYIFITDLQATTLSLDFRVTILEENGGGDGNNSVAELEVRVETLEETADDHEARISTTETDINGNRFSNFLPPDKVIISHVSVCPHREGVSLTETPWTETTEGRDPTGQRPPVYSKDWRYLSY